MSTRRRCPGASACLPCGPRGAQRHHVELVLLDSEKSPLGTVGYEVDIRGAATPCQISSPEEDMEPTLKAELDALVTSNKVVLFMKGNRRMPRCGFSATVVGILDGLTDHYETVDVLANPAIREGIKEYSDWPTLPQLYIDGEFQGGCDIVREMAASGDLHSPWVLRWKRSPHRT